MAPSETSDPWWRSVARPVFCGSNEVVLLRGGDMLFPAMLRAISQAEREIWIVTYIFNNDPAALAVAQALADAARRGVMVKVIVDGFGSKGILPAVQPQLTQAGVHLTVFRSLDRWWNWLQPGQLRRLHHKLCVVDGRDAFVGGINIIDDRFDLHHGWGDTPRLDFAVHLQGPVVPPVEQACSALWARTNLRRDIQQEVKAIARGNQPGVDLRRMIRRLRMPDGRGFQMHAGTLPPMRAAFVLRDNLRQRRTIERSYIDAIRTATQRVDLISAYFYPGQAFRRALRQAARRGVKVRLLLQGKLDYRIAGLAARALYEEMLGHGVRIFEYTPAFLHAKVGLVDDDWATVGSSNIDPLSLLLNLEANVVIRDAGFNAEMSMQFEAAIAESTEISREQFHQPGMLGAVRRALVAWIAHVYLRVAGATGRY